MINPQLAAGTPPQDIPPRISRDEMLMDIALTVAKRSTCLRKHLGAVIAKDSRPISIGYNGAPSGLEHCTPDTCGPDKPCTRTVHAEANAIAFAAKEGIRTDGCTLYATCTPCKNCADIIINAGIKRAVFKERYRDPQGLNMLHDAGIEVVMMP